MSGSSFHTQTSEFIHDMKAFRLKGNEDEFPKVNFSWLTMYSCTLWIIFNYDSKLLKKSMVLPLNQCH